MKIGKKILAVMMLAVFMLAANAVLVSVVEAVPRAFIQTPLREYKEARSNETSLADKIKAALLSGKSLQSVMDEALKDGKGINEIVAAAIKAGVRVDDAVYVAIKAAPKDVKSIFKAAIDTGAKLEMIAAAAKAAGIDRNAVIHALSANKVINDKMDHVLKVFDNTTYAYTPPADNTSSSDYKSGATVKNNVFFTYTVNNTGGSTPSTQTASPIL